MEGQEEEQNAITPSALSPAARTGMHLPIRNIDIRS